MIRCRSVYSTFIYVPEVFLFTQSTGKEDDLKRSTWDFRVSCFSSTMWGGGSTLCHHCQLQWCCGSDTLRIEYISLRHLLFKVSERQMCWGWWGDITQGMQQDRGHRQRAYHTLGQKLIFAH